MVALQTLFLWTYNYFMRFLLPLIVFIALLACGDKKNSNATAPITANIESQEEKQLIDAYTAAPDTAAYLENLIRYYVEKQNYDKAQAVLDKAIARDTANPELWDTKSMIALQKSDTLNGIKYLEKAAYIFPEPGYIIGLGSLYAQTKNPEALAMADALLQANKARAEKEAYFIKGLYYSFTNEKQKSIPFFDKSLALDYNFMEAYLEKGLALYDMKDYEGARKVFSQSVKVNPKFDRGYFYLGKTFEKLGNTQVAMELYETALQMDPNYIEAQDALQKLGIK
jgi:tetratricopeptide (TPR) repeat protein